ncbi:MAG: folylpolyglutamate synthase/dihydrofolate synthase family protein [Candidatus Woesearchaeota archaeon]
MRYNKIIELLYSRGFHSINLGLERIEKLMKKLGNPEKDLKVILIAGTNGKGSTAAMISSILMESGFKVGLYTSPHLVRFTERFRIFDKNSKNSAGFGSFSRGEEITKDKIEELFDKINIHLPKLDANGFAPTYFEIITAMAYLYFKEEGVDFAVVEVGMGGRLDATNIVNPMVSVITGISLDHTEYLGKNIVDITYEKAGIIKENGYVVTAAEDEAYDVLSHICMKKQATLLKATPTGLKLGLLGEFQKKNAGVAIKAVKTLKYFGVEIPKIALVNGLEKAIWAGRFEFLRAMNGRPTNVLVDCAHNVEGVECLVAELNLFMETDKSLGSKYMSEDINPNHNNPLNVNAVVRNFDKIHFVFGAMKDKDIKGMIKLIDVVADSIILTKPHGENDEMLERAEDPKNIAKLIDDNTKVKIIEKPDLALKKAKQIAGEDDLIVVCGSIFLIGDILRN